MPAFDLILLCDREGGRESRRPCSRVTTGGTGRLYGVCNSARSDGLPRGARVEWRDVYDEDADMFVSRYVRGISGGGGCVGGDRVVA